MEKEDDRTEERMQSLDFILGKYCAVSIGNLSQSLDLVCTIDNF